MTLDAASYDILWSIYDQTGIRPEWLLPVLYFESGLNPSAQNAYGYSGINQASSSIISSYAGTDLGTYVTWPASRQLDTVVRGMYADLVNHYGPIRSATRAYQANFLPATLATAHALSDVISSQGDSYYGPNAGLDVDHNGVITLGDLAIVMAKSAAAPAVQTAIANAYQVRPNETPQDPVYGQDFTSNFQKSVSMAIGGLALGGGLYLAWEWAARRYRLA